MLKTYTYPDETIKEITGQPPDHSLRFDIQETVDNPQDADVIIVPLNLTWFETKADMQKLPFFNEYESKHAFFHCSDKATIFNTTAILLQCNLKQTMKEKDINSLAIAWPVGKDDIDDCACHNKFTHDVGFHGWVWSDTRKTSTVSVQKTFMDNFDFAGYSTFTGHCGEKEYKRRRGLFLNSLKNCRVQLCPSSIPGDWPYRAWETMCAARVPALICSNDIRPRTDIINYDEFMLTIPAEKASEAGTIIKEFLNTHLDEQLIEMGKKGREAYIKYLDSRRWPQLFREMIQDAL